MWNELLLLTSEVILSAYPLLIKLVHVSVVLQTGLRMAVFAGLAFVAATLTGTPLAAATFLSKETIATGFLNLIHVFTSYTAFEQLTGGNAMALFYTYPVWNILVAMVFLKEKIAAASVPWIGLALAGAVALAHPTSTNWTLTGIIAALMAAITEAGIYVWFRAGSQDGKTDTAAEKEPWTKMIQMYGGSGVLWVMGIAAMSLMGFLAKNTLAINGDGFGKILAFNSLIGFIGYAMRFYIIPKVSTVVFSALSFFGIISAYVFDWIFTNQKPNMLQIAGAVAIIVANAVLVTRETA
jgi:drug/metabolite transporter (DMT)-like permease